jgi:hypothetical protein
VFLTWLLRAKNSHLGLKLPLRGDRRHHRPHTEFSRLAACGRRPRARTAPGSRRGAPWTRDGTVRAYAVTMAPEVAGRIIKLPVADIRNRSGRLSDRTPASTGPGAARWCRARQCPRERDPKSQPREKWLDIEHVYQQPPPCRLILNQTIFPVPHYNCREFTAHWLVGSPGMICRSGSGPIEI